MFDATAPADDWGAPGVARSAAPAGPAEDVVALTAAVEQALGVVPSVLAPAAAVSRAEALLGLQERLSAGALTAVADVEARELWRQRQAGSTRTWLRTLPCGDSGQLALSRLLQDRPVLGKAFADGDVSARTFAAVARQLARVPAHVAAEQLTGVLVDGLGDLMGVWAGAACLDPTPQQEAVFEQRREQLAEVVSDGLKDCWSDAAGQLEPAFTLAATVLAPTEVAAGVALLVDALQPEAQAEDAAEQAYASRGLTLRKVSSGGWSLRAHLTDEVGQRLFDELTARDPNNPAHKARVTRQQAAEHPDGVTVEDVLGPQQDEAGRDAGEPDGDGDVDDRTAGLSDDVHGQAHRDVSDDLDARADGDLSCDDNLGRQPSGTGGAGAAEAGSATDNEADPNDDDEDDDGASGARFGRAGVGVEPDWANGQEEGTPQGSRDQRAHDAFAQLLADLTTCKTGTGAPAPAQLTITATVDALDGRPGAPPGRLVTSTGAVSLTTGQLRRHGCTGILAAVLLDARGRPVGASGDHRHATACERRAMRAAWGSTCSVNGCTLPGTVPHHAEPWWKALQTALKDLVPLCEHHHHDVHDGSKTLRLRDGRAISEWGWA